ncbi:MAG: hypothetical protein ACM3QZ_08365 [Solirubrobacterales bacterium]
MAKVQIETKRPPVWQMVREAVEKQKGETSYKDIKDYIWKRYGDVKERTINCQIIICSVNQKSRIYYPPNRKARDCDSQYDFLYSLGNGRVTLYRPEIHGRWRIIERGSDLSVEQQDEQEELLLPTAERMIEPVVQPAKSVRVAAPMRDFIARNLNLLDESMRLFVDADDVAGHDYPTEAGMIELLAVDGKKRPVVIQTADPVTPETITKLLAGMGWARKHLPKGEHTRGILLFGQIEDLMMWSLEALPDVELYQVHFSIELKKV